MENKASNKKIIVKHKEKVKVSLSYQMVQDLINSKSTPLYIRFKLYFGIWQKSGKPIRCLNPFLANLFDVSEYQVKYHLRKLKEEGSILIKNEGSFRREIVVLEYIFITDEALTEEAKKKAEDLRQFAFGKSPVKDFVYLTQVELMDLQKLMGTEYLSYIHNLNKHIQETNAKYKSHYETLKAWWFKNQKQKQNKKKLETSPDFLGEEYLEETDGDDFYLGRSFEQFCAELGDLGRELLKQRDGE